MNNYPTHKISVTSKMFKKSHWSRWYFWVVYLPVFYVSYVFVGFFLAILLATVIGLIIFSVFLGARETFLSHYTYLCPNCKYNMTFSMRQEDMLTDSVHNGRCPKCAHYHEIDYKYDGTIHMKPKEDQAKKVDAKKDSPKEVKGYGKIK